MKNIKSKTKTVKGYAIYSVKSDDIADKIFTLRRSAKRYFDIMSESTAIEFENLPARHIARILKNYKIVPITITYNP